MGGRKSLGFGFGTSFDICSLRSVQCAAVNTVSELSRDPPQVLFIETDPSFGNDALKL